MSCLLELRVPDDQIPTVITESVSGSDAIDKRKEVTLHGAGRSIPSFFVPVPLARTDPSTSLRSDRRKAPVQHGTEAQNQCLHWQPDRTDRGSASAQRPRAIRR